jgi:DnaJ-class molecular chaperone
VEESCPRCDGAGVVFVQRMEVYTTPDGQKKSRSVEVEEKCPTCKGRGKVESRGSR